jgi:hypothetical protein
MVMLSAKLVTERILRFAGEQPRAVLPAPQLAGSAA